MYNFKLRKARFPALVAGHTSSNSLTKHPPRSPTPLEIAEQLAGCGAAAAEAGLDTAHVFYAGHSLGGVVLESYVRRHQDTLGAAGVALLGTWLPNLGPASTNE